MWEFLAIATVVAHLAYLVFLPIGGFLAWRWPRVLPVHLAAVLIGVASITVGFDCPLTTWERALWRRAGEEPYAGGFVDHYLEGRLFPTGADWAVQLVVGACLVVSYGGLLVRHRRRVRADATPPR